MITLLWNTLTHSGENGAHTYHTGQVFFERQLFRPSSSQQTVTDQSRCALALQQSIALQQRNVFTNWRKKKS